MTARIAIQKRRSFYTILNSEWLAGYLFASPFILGFLIFFAFPMIYSAWLAFHDWDLLSPPRYVGLTNFVKIFEDPLANLSLYNSAFYTIIAVPAQLVISFTLALALTQPVLFRDFYRAIFYLPIIVPLVAWAVVWQRMFHIDYGMFNIVLSWFGVEPRAWLSTTELAKPAMIIMSLWYIGRQMVIFIAGLTSIPPALLEAASIDGANGFRRITRIVVPLMTPFIFYNMVIAIVNSFQSFVPAAIMTEGGPENSTLFAVYYIWRQGFQFFNMGYASTLAWEFFIIVVGFTVAQFYISRRWVYYESD
ncbi:sugar ABC transporter permease [Chloroflexi bacterium TSY]|nr:sugar ABC transporter permease [Chloroflexi bacterium TSY]